MADGTDMANSAIKTDATTLGPNDVVASYRQTPTTITKAMANLVCKEPTRLVRVGNRRNAVGFGPIERNHTVGECSVVIYPAIAAVKAQVPMLSEPEPPPIKYTSDYWVVNSDTVRTIRAMVIGVYSYSGDLYVSILRTSNEGNIATKATQDILFYEWSYMETDYWSDPNASDIKEAWSFFRADYPQYFALPPASRFTRQ
jgi:hypothetical protein